MKLLEGDALTRLRELPGELVDCCITSPPYWSLRDYGVEGQIGLERTPEEYVARLVEVFREVRRVLRADGTAWVNLGDSYTGSANAGGELTRTCNGPPNARDRNLPTKYGAGLKPKDLCGIPWRVAFALQSDGWYLRSDIIWAKPNPMPESVTDRCTKAHEYVFMLAKQERYFYDADAIAEPASDSRGCLRFTSDRAAAMGRNPSGNEKPERYNVVPRPETRNRRSVWTLATLPTPDAHFATFPIELPETCLLAGSRPGGIVLDPFSGAGTTGLAAIKHGRDYIGIDLNPKYIEISRARLERHMPLFSQGETA